MWLDSKIERSMPNEIPCVLSLSVIFLAGTVDGVTPLSY